ncbi:MAG: hypothetical protein HDQ88_04690 [Clostridia bacterium]|nr:hypothetical protein [Clostridia bacterium]
MNTFDQNLISSSVIIHDLIEDYNVQSMDFVTRLPSWICQCLSDLNIQLHYVDAADELEFNEYRCEIPDGCKNIKTVIIDKHRAEFTTNPAPIVADNESYIPLAVSFPVGHLAIEHAVFDLSELHRDTKYLYSINGNYLNLNVCKGRLGLIYSKLPFILDSVLKINVPLIPNNDILKEAIKNFVMIRMLQRGYKHHTFNLKENNPYTNVAMMYDNNKIKVRNACNRLTKDKRDDCTRSLLNFFNLKNHYIN